MFLLDQAKLVFRHYQSQQYQQQLKTAWFQSQCVWLYMDLFGAYVQKSAHIFIAFIDLKPHIFKNAIKRGEKKRKKKNQQPTQTDF